MSYRTAEHVLRRHVTAASHTLWDRGWVANHDGNVTAKSGPGRIVATPTGVSKRDITIDGLIVVDEQKRIVRGRAKVFSEIGLHLKVYEARPDAGAVVHAHCPYATAFGLTHANALPSFLPEAVVSIGVDVPVVPLAMPGADAEQALAPFVVSHDAVMLAGNGVLSWGDDLEQAMLRMELVEHLARIASIARQENASSVPELPRDMVEALLAKRTAAGLGPEGRRK